MAISKVPPSGMDLRCPRCLHRFHLSPDGGPDNFQDDLGGLDDDPFADVIAETKKPSSGADDPLDLLADFANELDQIQPSGPAESDGTTYQVRRQSGKIFGPFDAATILKMLEQGQLTGKEDLSPGDDFWSPMVDWPEFRDAVSKMGITATTPGREDTGGISPRRARPQQENLDEFLFEENNAEPAPAPEPPKRSRRAAASSFVSAQPTSSASSAPSAPISFENHIEPARSFTPAPASEPMEMEMEIGDSDEPVRPTRATRGRVRSALKQEIMEQENTSKKKIDTKLLALAGGLVLVLLVLLFYVLFFSKPKAKQYKIVDISFKKPFSQDTYIEYNSKLVPNANRMYQQDPNNPSAKRIKAIALAMKYENHPSPALRGQVKKAMDEASVKPKNQEKKKGPPSTKELMFEAMKALFNKNGPGVMNWSRQLQQREPQNLEALYLKAKGQELQGQIPQAIQTYDKVIGRMGQHARALFAKGKCYLKQKKWSQAFKAFHEVTLVTNDHLPAFIELFRLEKKVPANKARYKLLWKAAAKAFDRSRAPKMGSNFYSLYAQRIQKQGQYDEALTLLQKAVKMSPTRKLTKLLPRYRFLTRKYNKTIAALKQKVQRNPKDFHSGIYLVRSLYRIQNIQDAEIWARQLSEKNKKLCAIWNLRGIVATSRGQYHDAIKLHDKCVFLNNEESKIARVHQAYAAWRLKKPKATEKLLKLLKLGKYKTKATPPPAPKKGKKGKKGKKAKKIKKKKRKIKKLSPEAAFEFELAQLRLFYTMDQTKGLVQRTQKLLKQYPNDELLHRFLGKLYLENNTLTKSQYHFQKAIKIWPKQPSAIFGLAEVHQQQSELNKAGFYFEKYIKQRPQDPMGYYRSGKLAFILKKYALAKQRIEKALELKEAIADAHYYKAQLLARDKSTPKKEIRRAYEEAIRLSPGTRTYLYALARFFYKNRQNREAMDIYKRMLKAKGQTKQQKAEVYFDRGKLYYEIQYWRPAMKDFKKAIRMDKKRQDIAYWIADIYKENRKFGKGIRWFKRALKHIQEPKKRSEIFGKLGEIYRQQRGKSTLAIRSYKKALGLNPKAYIYHRELGYLYKDQKSWLFCAREFKRFLKKAPKTDTDRREVFNDRRACLRESGAPY